MNVYYSQLKAETRPPNFRESWAKAVEMLEKGVDEVVQNPAGFVPSVKFSDIRKSTVPREVIEQIRRTGVAKIMGVVPKEAAKLMNESIMTDLKQTFGVTGVPMIRDLVPETSMLQSTRAFKFSTASAMFGIRNN